MIKLKFIGETDDEFTNGKIYELLNINANDNFVYVFLTNDNKGISFIPYVSLYTFNKNWEVIKGR